MRVGDEMMSDIDTCDAIFKALASKHRRDILQMLSDAAHAGEKTCCAPEEICACKVSERIGLSASTISHHISALRDAGLIFERKDGLWSYYSLNRDTLKIVTDFLNKL